MKVKELAAENHHLKERVSVLESEKQTWQSEKNTLQTEKQTLEAGLLAKELEILALRKALFGKKSERFLPKDPNQLKLDFEQGVDIDERLKQVMSEYPYKPKAKKEPSEKQKPKRLPVPAAIPRHEEIVSVENLPAGAKLIGTETTEVLEYKPAEVYVRKIVRNKYVWIDADGQERILIAEMPHLAFPKQIAGASVIAKILYSKYVEHLPLYRQQQQFRQMGMDVPTSTIVGWTEAGIEKLRPLYDKIGEAIKKCDYLQVDESYMPVVKEDRPNATVKGYVWGLRAPKRNLAYFHWDEGSRAGAVIHKVLDKYQGAIQSDGYGAYNVYENTKGITLLGCWAHARRYFEKALKEDPQNAEIALGMIQYLYRIEREMQEQELPPDQIAERRKRDAYPLLLKFQEWMLDIYPKVLPKSRIGTAISYTTNIWKRLARYVNDGNYLIDNNGIERAIRPITIGRKNYLFCGSNDSAERTAIIYTIAACCKLAEVDTQEYLEDVMNRIDDLKLSELDQLFPIAWKKAKQEKAKKEQEEREAQESELTNQ